MTTSKSSPSPGNARTTSRRSLIGAVAALLGAAALDSVSAQDATPEASSSPMAIATDPLPYLFIQTADQGAWQPKRGQPGAYLLTLSSVSPQTIVIRDEPTDAAGTIPTSDFFDAVRFSVDRPLQGVVSVQSSTGEDVLVVSLFRATYDASIGELVYVATRLDNYVDQHGVEPLQTQTGNYTLPSEFGATTLFVTNAYCRDESGETCRFG